MDTSIPSGRSEFSASRVVVGNNSKFHQGNTYILNGAWDGRSTDGRSSSVQLDEAQFEVFLDLLCLDLGLLHQVQQTTSKGNTELFGNRDYDWIVSHLQKHRISAACYGTPYQGHISEEKSLRKELSLMSKDEQSSYIRSSDLVPYYSRLYEQCLANSRRARARVDRMEQRASPTLHVLEAEFVELHGNNYALFPNWCYKQVEDAHRALRLIYEIPLRLKKHIREVAEKSPSWPALSALKTRMEAIQESFPEVCGELKRPEQRLVGTDTVWWSAPIERVADPIASTTTNSQKQSRSPEDGVQGETQTWHMPSNSTVSRVNGPQINSGVFNGPVHFGNVYGGSAKTGKD